MTALWRLSEPYKERGAKMEKNCTFATFARWTLEDQGISISELARRTGIDRNQLSQYINGNHEPTPQNKKKINEAIGIDYDSVMKKRLDLVLSMETDIGLESFLKTMQHYYHVLPPKDRNKLLELGEALEIQMQSRLIKEADASDEFLGVDDIKEMFGVGRNKAYEIIKQINVRTKEEIPNARIISGKVNMVYLQRYATGINAKRTFSTY